MRHVFGVSAGALEGHGAGRDAEVDGHAVYGARQSTFGRGQGGDLSYAQLHALSNRFANALAGLGVAAGGPVFTLLGRMPALHIALSGALKHRCVVTPVPPQGRGHPQPAAGARARDRRA